jgi:hypothetical protein
MLLIAFGHKRQRGKDTSAQYLAEGLISNGVPVVLDSFASPLKKVCETVFGFTAEQMNVLSEKIKEDPFWGFTPRWALQIVGTEAFRYNVVRDVWVRSMERRYLQEEQHRIITDLRLVDEAEMVRRFNGILIKCNRDVPYDSQWDDHLTETSLDGWVDWDFEIDNNGSKKHLIGQIDNILAEVLKRI